MNENDISESKRIFKIKSIAILLQIFSLLSLGTCLFFIYKESYNIYNFMIDSETVFSVVKLCFFMTLTTCLGGLTTGFKSGLQKKDRSLFKFSNPFKN